LVGVDDIDGIGSNKGLHHLDAKALIRAEEHRVVNGVSRAALSLCSHTGITWH
jgi:hypothetical protein